MKFLLCSLNSKYIHSSLAPYYLLSGIREFGKTEIDTSILEGTVNENEDALLEKILAYNADAIGFSVYIWNINRVKSLISKIKSLAPHTVIILGGPEVSYNPREILSEYPDTDFILSGEGERNLPALLDSLQSGDNIPSDMGICYRNGSEIIVSEPQILCEDPPSPYVPEYLENLKNRISYIETSRGCPYRCAFCLSGRCGGVRFFDLNKSLENILLLANSGSKTVKFIDRTFNANCQRAKKIISFIIENYGTKIPDGVCFHFEIAGDILDNELIELLNSAPKGSIQLEIGLQSFNEQTLAAVNRKTDTAVLTQNIKKLIAPRNIHIHIDLIAGLPYEDLGSFRESFNKAFSLGADMLQLGFLKFLHGSDLRDEPFGAKYSLLPPYEVISTPWLNDKELSLLHLTEKALDNFYCSGRFLDTIRFLLSETGLSPFDLFTEIGTLTENDKTPMQSAGVILSYGESKGINKEKLRDIMVCDWLSKSPTLPQSLRVHDSRLKKIGIQLDEIPETRRQKNIKRSIAILYSESRAVYFDYTEPEKITGRYKMSEVPISVYSDEAPRIHQNLNKP